ncbi:MAG: type I methionyl aminopeptidase [Candidatus Levybacteria bacterium CG10_big_fil_rev_8_21_14_0_10_36_7]|nr:MAG: type I methionyl aminopeptidase [Candidatus Levybacteria bacterium CG10_big_fil_rev_8_21_14_0_10_36_7]
MDNHKIDKMTQAGNILGQVLEESLKFVSPGITEIEIDKFSQKKIEEKGGFPGFKRVPGYKNTICASTNSVVVHGIPGPRRLVRGDVFGIDCGVYLDGYHTDMAETIVVGGKGSVEVEKFLKVGKNALFEAIKQAKPGNRVGHISKKMQEIVEKEGYSIVRNLVGHGVGKELHEKPEIPGYLLGKLEKTPILKVGMTIAIEVIYNMGDREVVYDGHDDWTLMTEDGSISGLFERTVLIEKTGPKLLTRLSTDPM